jgi:hypothetical protein
LEAFTPFVRAIDRSAAAIDSGQCLGGKDTHCAPAFSRLARACIGLTHLWRNGSDLPAMPGLGRSVYREAGRSSSERVTPTGHEKTGSKKRGTTTQQVAHACSSAMHVFQPLILAWSQTCLNSRRCACAVFQPRISHRKTWRQDPIRCRPGEGPLSSNNRSRLETCCTAKLPGHLRSRGY